MTQTVDQPVATQISARPLMRVAVCIATHRRPDGLRRLLQSLEHLTFRDGADPDVRVIVVDNDPASAAGIDVCGTMSGFRWPLEALPEPRKGISFARNRALGRALELGVDAIIFVDDDEVPEPEWLEGLLQVHRASGPEIVTGPVEPWFEEAVPDWIVRGNFFDRGRFPTGTELPFARTGNLLLDAHFLKASGLRFDDRFGLSGGEDTLLTLKLKQLGARIVWADNAAVRESVPSTRASAGYILRRSYLAGNNWTRIQCLLNPGPAMIAKRAFLGICRIAEGALLLIPSMLQGRRGIVRSLRKSCLGWGSLAGLMQVSVKFYE
jgi:hypothetical protein